jgi:hypothetical protein
VNLAHVNIAIRQRSVLESVDLSLPFCLRLGKRLYGRLALLILVPAWALCVGLGYAFELNWVLLWLIALVLQSLAQGVFTLAAGRLVFEGEVAAKAILRDYFSKLPAYAAGLLWTRTLIVLTLATFMLLLPIAWIRYAYAHEVLLLEQATLKRLGSRSGAIVKGHTGVAAQTLVCLFCITVAGILACELLGTGIVSYLLQLGSPFGSLFEDGGSVYALLGLFLATPVVATARFLSYIDGRTRRDAWDIQVRFQQLRTEAGAKVL